MSRTKPKNVSLAGISMRAADYNVLSLLTSPKKIATINRELNSLNARTIRYSLNKLLDKGLITKIPDFQDLRSDYYLAKGAETIDRSDGGNSGNGGNSKD